MQRLLVQQFAEVQKVGQAAGAVRLRKKPLPHTLLIDKHPQHAQDAVSSPGAMPGDESGLQVVPGAVVGAQRLYRVERESEKRCGKRRPEKFAS